MSFKLRSEERDSRRRGGFQGESSKLSRSTAHPRRRKEMGRGPRSKVLGAVERILVLLLKVMESSEETVFSVLSGIVHTPYHPRCPGEQFIHYTIDVLGLNTFMGLRNTDCISVNFFCYVSNYILHSGGLWPNLLYTKLYHLY